MREGETEIGPSATTKAARPLARLRERVGVRVAPQWDSPRE
ncbi:hypothetical protein ACVWW5_007750 [Bradyrhizobium sp. LM3.4]